MRRILAKDFDRILLSIPTKISVVYWTVFISISFQSDICLRVNFTHISKSCTGLPICSSLEFHPAFRQKSHNISSAWLQRILAKSFDRIIIILTKMRIVFYNIFPSKYVKKTWHYIAFYSEFKNIMVELRQNPTSGLNRLLL